MGTERQQCEPGVDDKGPHWLSDPFWSRLNKADWSSRREGQSHERASVLSAGRRDLDAVWQRYCEVIRELEMTAADLEALSTSRQQPASVEVGDGNQTPRSLPGKVSRPCRGP